MSKGKPEVEVAGEQGKLPLLKQWYFRAFLSNLLLLGLFIFMMSPVLTFLYFMGIARSRPESALMWTVLHAIASFLVLFLDVMKQVWSTTAKKFIFGRWYESGANWWQYPIELQDEDVIALDVTTKELSEVTPLPNPAPLLPEARQKIIQTLESLRPKISEGEKKEVEDYIGAYNILQVRPKGHRSATHLWLVPKPHTYQTAFPAHRESTLMRYPIPTWVSYGDFTLMAMLDYEGVTVPIYEVTYAPGLVRERQERLPWFNPSSSDVENAIFQYDKAIGTKWKGSFEQLLRYVKFLLAERIDAEEYGKDVAKFLLDRAEIAGERPEQQRKLSRGWLKYILGFGLVAIAFVLILAGLGVI